MSCFMDAWPWQDDPCQHHRKRIGRQYPDYQRTCLGTQGDLAAILTNLDESEVLFIDEIPPPAQEPVEEILYSAYGDYALGYHHRQGPAARSVRLDLPRFTLIGATTRMGSVAAPLRDRFGVICHLEFTRPRNSRSLWNGSGNPERQD